MRAPRRTTRWGGAVAVAATAAGLPIALGATPASAADTDIRITEIAPRGNSTALGDDWVELTNFGTAAIDLTGWKLDDDGNSFSAAGVITGVTTVAPGESVVLVTEADSSSVAAFASQWYGGTLPAGLQVGWVAGSGLGLGNGGDAVNVFNPSGTRVANADFGSAPSGSPIPTLDNSAGLNGTISTPSVAGVNGAFVSANGAEVGSPGLSSASTSTPPDTTPPTTPPDTTPPPPPPSFSPWPGSPDVQPAENYDFGEDMSGLDYESGPDGGVLWAARNKAGTLFRLVLSGGVWVPDTADGWGAGKALRYPGGTGHADSEGLTYAGTSAAEGIYIAAERDNDNSGVSRNSLLRYDVSGTGTELVATTEWNLTADLPATGANLGLEAVTWIGDADLAAAGFVDESTGLAYSPATYPGATAGVFFVALEQTGQIYAYVLFPDGTFHRVATIASDLTIVTDLQYDPDTKLLWAECDNTCSGRLTVLEVEGGAFVPTAHYERPANLADNNNEGFAIAPDAQCVDGLKPVYWADDGGTGGVSIVEGALGCDVGPSPVVPEFPLGALGALSAALLLGGWYVLRRRRDGDPVLAG